MRTEIDFLLNNQINKLIEQRNYTSEQIRIGINKSINESQRNTNKLLERAEFIISIPLAYYLGHIIHHVSKTHTMHKLLTHVGLPLQDLPEETSFAISSLLVLVWLFVLWLRRWGRHGR